MIPRDLRTEERRVFELTDIVLHIGSSDRKAFRPTLTRLHYSDGICIPSGPG
jgi:hypothetical protein